MTDAIAAFAGHVARTRYEDLPPEAVRAAKIFILDSLGVGIAGSAGPWVENLVACQQGWGSSTDARVWVRGTALPAPSAAMCNAYQIHNSEYDCVHELAVVHPMAVLLSATVAHAERAGGVSGRDLLTAVALGVDVACGLGVASKASLKFFRPATAGGFAATAAIGKLMGFEAPRLVDAFGIVYSQMCGTMQAHTEGLLVLGMQIGFNARNAVFSCDMAARGLAGPQNVLEGPFGFLNLFEGSYDLAPVLAGLGRSWRICEVAHKPFPTGRATHGVLDAVLTLQREHGFAAGDVEKVEARVPPLTHRLVGRPIRDDMLPNYARLCTPYVTARALLTGTVDVGDFAEAPRRDPVTLALGRRIEVLVDDNPDPNALTPITVEIALKDGRRLGTTLSTIYGNPAKPMSREAHLDKFRRNARAGSTALPEAKAEALIEAVDDIESLADVRDLIDLTIA